MPPHYFNLIPHRPQKILINETSFKCHQGKSSTHLIGSSTFMTTPGLSNYCSLFHHQRTRLYLLFIYMIFCLIITLKYLPFFQFPREVALAFTNKHPIPKDFILYEAHCVHPNMFEPKIVEDSDRITQVLHISSNFLDNRIVDQVKNWKGPVSLAVLITNKEEYSCTINKITEIMGKFPEVGANLRVHFISDLAWNSDCYKFINESTPCLKKSKKSYAFYPANVARNVARKYAKTEFVLIADFEHMFSVGFEEEVRLIAKEQLNDTSRKVLVYRIFEIDQNANEPKTIFDLKKLYDKKKAVVFHSMFYKGAHDIPKLPKWFQDNGTGIFMEDVKYTKFNWEPQFVSRNDIPLHDVNFPYMIRDNTVLRWELCRAKYHFTILKRHFMFHKGIKKRGRMLPIPESIANIRRFNKALVKFNKRMNETFPSSFGDCPKFQA